MKIVVLPLLPLRGSVSPLVIMSVTAMSAPFRYIALTTFELLIIR